MADDIGFHNESGNSGMNAPGTPGIEKDFSRTIEEAMSARELAVKAHASGVSDNQFVSKELESQANAPNA